MPLGWCPGRQAAAPVAPLDNPPAGQQDSGLVPCAPRPPRSVQISPSYEVAGSTPTPVTSSKRITAATTLLPNTATHGGPRGGDSTRGSGDTTRPLTGSWAGGEAVEAASVPRILNAQNGEWQTRAWSGKLIPSKASR